MTNKQKVLKVLENQKLTSSEISEKTGIDTNSIYVILNRMLKNEDIERSTDKKPYKYSIVKKLDNEFYKNILMKMIPTFVKSGVNIDTFTNEEEEAIMEIAMELQSKGEI